MIRCIRRAVAIGAIAFFGSASQAHHSFSMFDLAKTQTVTGTITQFQYVMPHSWLFVNAKGPDGKMTTYSFELAAPTLLRRMGINKGTFVPGEKVKAEYNPMRDGRPAGQLRSVTKPDGTVIKTFT